MINSLRQHLHSDHEELKEESKDLTIQTNKNDNNMHFQRHISEAEENKLNSHRSQMSQHTNKYE